MPAGKLIAAYAYQVHPQQDGEFVGGAVHGTPQLQSALDATYDRSRVENAPTVTFCIDTSGDERAHPVRQAAIEIAFAAAPDEESSVCRALALRLAQSMDNRSKPALLVVSVHHVADATRRRLLLWTFPQQDVFSLSETDGSAQLEMLEAFNRESNLRKVALLEGDKTKSGMLTARVLDFQSTATDHSVADLWIVKFLDARLQMSSVEGTQVLARALRHAFAESADDADSLEELSAAIGSLRMSHRQRWSLKSFADEYLGADSARLVLSQAAAEAANAQFELDRVKFDHLIQYRRFLLENGVVVSAPFAEMGVDGGVEVVEGQGQRRLRIEGVITEEGVRTRA